MSIFVTAAKKNKPKPKPKVTKKKNDKGLVEDDEEEQDQQEEEKETKVVKIVKSIDLEYLIQPKALAPYLRRLDPHVFTFVKYPLHLTKEQVDINEIMLNISNATQSEATMKSFECFSVETWSFLLIEIKQQATDKLHKLDILAIPDLLSSLCSYMDVITNNEKV